MNLAESPGDTQPSAGKTTTIELSNVSKHFGSSVALEGVDLKIEDGEFVVLLGPSGCGKSTLLRILAGLEQPTEGTVLINATDVTAVPPGERDLAFVFQSYALYPHMTVRRNMAFPLLMERYRWWNQLPGLSWLLYRQDVRDPSIVERVAAAAELLGLQDMLDRHPRTLSGGQRQRVALGRALVRDPSAFLMDEPLSNLDAKLRQQMRVGLRELHAAVGRTIVYVTHDQVEAMTMGTKIVVMDTGRVIQVGTPAEIYRRPETTYVAGFVGSPPMNLMPARLLGDETGSCLTFDVFGGRIRCRPDVSEAPEITNEEFVVGVRPEDIEIRAHDGNEPNSRWCEARIHLVEDLGGESIVQLVRSGENMGGGFFDNSTDVVTARVSGPVPAQGTQVDIGVKQGQDVNVFAGASGRRLLTAPAH